MSDMVYRFEDMSPGGKLCLLEQDDGDVIISIWPDPGEDRYLFKSVEFCMPVFGGGQSPRTLRALKELMLAMEEDNKLDPQSKER